MVKSAEAFRTISEVAELLDTPAHVLRFWESRFTQIRPVKRAGGRRYYRPADIALLGGIKRLLHDDGITIRGVQKILKEQGIRHVAAQSPVHIETGAAADEHDAIAAPAQAEPQVAASVGTPAEVPEAHPVDVWGEQPAEVQVAAWGEEPAEVPTEVQVAAWVDYPAEAQAEAQAGHPAEAETGAPAWTAPGMPFEAPARVVAEEPSGTPDWASRETPVADAEPQPQPQPWPQPWSPAGGQGALPFDTFTKPPAYAPAPAPAPAEEDEEIVPEAPMHVDAPTLPIDSGAIRPLGTVPYSREPAAPEPAPDAATAGDGEGQPAATLLRAMDTLRARDKQAELMAVYLRLTNLKERLTRTTTGPRP